MNFTIKHKDRKEVYGIGMGFGYNHKFYLHIWHNTIRNDGGFTLRPIHSIIDDWR